MSAVVVAAYVLALLWSLARCPPLVLCMFHMVRVLCFEVAVRVLCFEVVVRVLCFEVVVRVLGIRV